MRCIELLREVMPKNILEKEEDKLSETEKVFRELIQYFLNPDAVIFDLSKLNKLDKNYLLLALKAIHQYYADSYILNETQMLIIEKDNPLLNQAAFVEILQQYGLNFDYRKLNVYYKRGVLPNADLEIQGKPYWFKSTVIKYIQSKFATLSYQTD